VAVKTVVVLFAASKYFFNCLHPSPCFYYCYTYILYAFLYGIKLLLPLKIVPPYTVISATSSLTSWLSSLTINILHPATWRLPAPPIHA